MTMILDDCESEIKASCSFETNTTVMDFLDDCKKDWDTLKNKTKECEQLEIPDCLCWQTVSDMKDEFKTKCFQGGTNSTGYS